MASARSRAGNNHTEDGIQSLMAATDLDLVEVKSGRLVESKRATENGSTHVVIQIFFWFICPV